MPNDDLLQRQRATQAMQRVQAMPAGRVVSRYLDGLLRRGELIPGAYDILQAAVRAGATPSGVTRDLRRGESGTETVSNIADFLAGPGRIYVAPRPAKPDGVEEPPLRAVLSRFGVPTDEAEVIYKAKAGEFAGRTEGGLVGAVIRVLSEHEDGKYLGVGEVTPPSGLPASGGSTAGGI